MSAIRGGNTAPEMAVRRALHAAGLRYRLHQRTLPGRPDIVLPRYRAAVFVHGCFWHRHPGCPFATNPRTNVAFWEHKFAGNVERDLRQQQNLTKLGWRVFVVWECEVRDVRYLTRLVKRIRGTHV